MGRHRSENRALNTMSIDHDSVADPCAVYVTMDHDVPLFLQEGADFIVGRHCHA